MDPRPRGASWKGAGRYMHVLCTAPMEASTAWYVLTHIIFRCCEERASV